MKYRKYLATKAFKITAEYDKSIFNWFNDRYKEDGLVVLGVPTNDFNQELSKDSEVKEVTSSFVSEEVIIKELDYFYTNSISRASKTMSECRQIKQNSKKTGTNNL